VKTKKIIQKKIKDVTTGKGEQEKSQSKTFSDKKKFHNPREVITNSK
jgi:hypothetical protein